jgi:hypothetical protein
VLSSTASGQLQSKHEYKWEEQEDKHKNKINKEKQRKIDQLILSTFKQAFLKLSVIYKLILQQKYNNNNNNNNNNLQCLLVRTKDKCMAKPAYESEGIFTNDFAKILKLLQR